MDQKIELTSELVAARSELVNLNTSHAYLEDSHTQCPYWIQMNKRIACAFRDCYEELKQENERLQDLYDTLNAQFQRFSKHPFNRLDDIKGENDSTTS